MKLPNRYGSVTKLSGVRRKPYIVKEGRTGKQKVIGYAATKADALRLLAEYNGTPWDVESKSVTLAEVWNGWLLTKSKEYSENYVKTLTCAYNCISALHEKSYNTLNIPEVQEVLDSLLYTRRKVVKSLFMQLDKYALQKEIISTDRMRGLDLGNDNSKHYKKFTFTDSEVKELWSDSSDMAKSVLILLYTGLRIQEAIEITPENIKDNCFICGSKTKAGKNRIIPIHEKIVHLVGDLISRYKKIIEPKYNRNTFCQIMKSHYHHTPHECRHTFRTWLDNAGANKVCIDRLMGHSSPGVGENVYTHKTIEDLKASIKLITK